jgi:hypothetical protein
MVACSSLSGVAHAQLSATNPTAVPRDNAIAQAVVDTACAAEVRAGGSCDSVEFGATKIKMNDAFTAARAANRPSSGSPTWMSVLRSLQDYLPWPLGIGKKGTEPACANWDSGAPGCFFGGGGAGGSWEAVKSSGPTHNCSEVGMFLAVDGSLIIPSFPLAGGGPMDVKLFSGTAGGTTCGSCFPSTWTGSKNIYADNRFHVMKWRAHKTNLVTQVDKRKWYGVVGCNDASGVYSCTYATVPYRDANGVIVARQQSGGSATEGGFGGGSSETPKPCPASGSTGGDFEFYDNYGGGTAPGNAGCTWYAPDYSLSSSGYAINDFTTLPFTAVAQWPIGATAIAPWMRACLIDPTFLAKLTEALQRKGGVTNPNVQPTDARPGDAQVNDLGGNPDSTNVNQPAGPHSTDPPPTIPGTSNPSVNVTVDFGPNPGTPEPQLSEPATNIMDPIFNWLPDLPHLTLNTASAQCPTWNLDLSAFGGSGWQWTMDKQCELAESVRSTLSALMLVIWGLGAAVVILRA